MINCSSSIFNSGQISGTKSVALQQKSRIALSALISPRAKWKRDDNKLNIQRLTHLDQIQGTKISFLYFNINYL